MKVANEFEQDTRLRHGMVALEIEGEARRNHLLRRVDWRFLVGNAHPNCTMVFAGGLLEEAVRLVSDTVVTPKEGTLAECDLAVAVNPSARTLRASWDALAPGGALYTEWYRPWAGGLQRIGKRLQDAGFRPAGSYWPWPLPGRAIPAFWLPLEAPRALRYFLENRPPAPTRLGKTARESLKRIWQLGYRLGLLSPVCSVAYKPVESDAASGLPEYSLQARTQNWGFTDRVQKQDWLLLTGGLHSTNKVIALVFEEDGARPSAIVKLPRREESLASLDAEASSLQAVEQRVGELPGVPRLLFMHTDNDFPALGESHLTGDPLYSRMHSDNVEELAFRAAEWLLQLVETGPFQPKDAWWERLVSPVLADFAGHYASVVGTDLLEKAEDILVELPALPLAVEQRDFSPWNVFLDPQGELVVLDWEGAEPLGLPGSDLIYFLTYLAFFQDDSLERGTFRETYRNLWNTDTDLGEIAARAYRMYFERLGIDLNALRPLRVLTWLRHATLEAALVYTSSDGESSPELLHRGLFFSLLQEELL